MSPTDSLRRGPALSLSSDGSQTPDALDAMCDRALDGPASGSSTGDGPTLSRFSSYEWRTDLGRLMRCSAPAPRSIWRLARFETECRLWRCSGSVRRGYSPAPAPKGSVGSMEPARAGCSRGTAGGGGVDGRRRREEGGSLGVELVGFQRRAAERRRKGRRVRGLEGTGRLRKGEGRNWSWVVAVAAWPLRRKLLLRGGSRAAAGSAMGRAVAAAAPAAAAATGAARGEAGLGVGAGVEAPG
ncbi:hypothetical protein VTK73DRAFT_2608 [Phialemonium thermophilum]|uniref:Uncharacterized protein n=1 Tax=Phialemonium thermophilum TaxID=223376 RepID=A0ABR3X3L6_9PEZI